MAQTGRDGRVTAPEPRAARRFHPDLPALPQREARQRHERETSMARKPNYSFERMERDRADAKKAAEKAAKKAEKKAQAAWEAGEGPNPNDAPAED